MVRYCCQKVELINYILDAFDLKCDPIVASLTTRLESKFDALTI